MQKVEATETERGFVTSAQFHLKGKDFTKALATVKHGLGKFPDSVMLLEIQGGLLLQEKQFDAAAAAYTNLAGIAPERGYGLLIRLYFVSDQKDKREQLITDLLKTHPDQDYPYLLAARVALQKRDVDGAIDTLQVGISKVNQPVRLQMDLGQLYGMTGKLEQSEKIYQSVIEKAPRLSVAYSSLGAVKEQMGDKGAALELYRSAVKYDKRNVKALNNLAYLLADNFGEAKKALGSAMSAYRLQPGDPRIMDTLAFVLLKNNKVKEAVVLLEKAHKLLPEVQTVGLHLAMAKIKTGELETAKQLLQDVIKKGQPVDVDQAKLLLKTI
jgi:FimV-like protein